MLEDIELPFVKIKNINKYENEYQIGQTDGKGVMYSIDVYPGIQVIYNDFIALKRQQIILIRNAILKSTIV